MRAELACFLSRSGLPTKSVAEAVRYVQDWQDSMEAELRVTRLLCCVFAIVAVGGYFIW